ncbi:hypothetical protein B1B04_10360 [Lysinibacillus sp. KCTC 33748]|uniref:hypothetical protein n=1 Tax=unclassified Lysinibacillus TaxID=2636778 RepID=UPI0009A71AB6|nr:MULTISPECIES: hypothetical protein [unclassified Lysinibacillus]OXS74008.1 hypothetical protein B1B04_10360 [Lysinibacillus sp. KCTC 33748]
MVAYVFGFFGLVIQDWNGEMSMETNLLTKLKELPTMLSLASVVFSNALISLAAGLVLFERQLNIRIGN